MVAPGARGSTAAGAVAQCARMDMSHGHGPDAGGSPAFRDLLKRYRAAVGLTQEELAERARLSVRAIADLERGARRTPRKDTVHLLAVALSLSPDDRALFEAAARPRIMTSTLLPPASILGPAGGALPPLAGRAGERAA